MSSSTSGTGPSKSSAIAKDERVNQFYQFKVRLVDTKPPVWRRIQVPLDYTFWGLHCVIQNSMGWNDNHLHCFHIKNPRSGKSVKVGKPLGKGGSWSVDENTQQGLASSPWLWPSLCSQGIGEMIDLIPKDVFTSWKVPLTKYYTADTVSYQTEYRYDFGDNWVHEIILEGIFPCEPGKSYPLCIEGKRACPPEDCSGTFGFDELLDNLKKKPSDRTKDEKEKIDWLHNFMKMPDYDPDYFDPSSVVFINPEMWLAHKKVTKIDKGKNIVIPVSHFFNK